MSRKWTSYHLRSSLKMFCYFVVLALMFGTLGCAMLQEAPPVEISASWLSCPQHPAMVDGNLETVDTFEAAGVIRKRFERSGINQRQYQRQVIGSLRTGTLIKLDAPIYIDYIEVYPASTIPHFTLDATAEEKSSKWLLSFAAVEDKRTKKMEGTQPVRFRIGREILYLRLGANALEAPESPADREATLKELQQISPEVADLLRQSWRKSAGDGEMWIRLKGAAIREIKFYGRQ